MRVAELHLRALDLGPTEGGALGEKIVRRVADDLPVGDEPNRPGGFRRLTALPEHALIKTSINLDAANTQEIDALLEAQSDYVALVRKQRCEGPLSRADGERLVAGELMVRIRKMATSLAEQAG